MSKEELLKYLIAEIDLIMHDKDYRFENQDGTWYSRESCKDLTNEEVFKELKSELMQLNSQVEKITDLEAKLAESEKKFNVANNLRKNSDEVLLNYKTEKYGLDKTIQELRKMKLSLPEKEWYYKGFENCERQMSSHIADLTLEVKQLKQQLAEKDKEIEKWKTKWCESEKNSLRLYEQNLNKNQDKIDFAVEQLEKVKEEMTYNGNGYCEVRQCSSPHTPNLNFAWFNYVVFNKFIDNQIKQLKEK